MVSPSVGVENVRPSFAYTPRPRIVMPGQCVGIESIEEPVLVR